MHDWTRTPVTFYHASFSLAMSVPVDPRLGGKQSDDDANMEDRLDSPLQPATPLETLPPDASQITLPSTEVPGSPIDPSQSFKTQSDDDDERMRDTIIPSSMTPPPSTQIEPPPNGMLRRTISQSQQTNLVSPPATLNNHVPLREPSSDYVAPKPRTVLNASADELRAMLETSIAEQQKLKTETAHYKMQYSLLSIQSEEDAKRSVVEYEMLRKEIEALRMAEHSRQAKQDLSSTSGALQIKYFELKTSYEDALHETNMVKRRLKAATKIIQEKDRELMNAMDEREQLLTRIRENREHMQKLCSPGGMFYDVLTPKQPSPSIHLNRGTPRQALRGENVHGINTLLEAASQDDDNNNNSAPTTPIHASRPLGRRAAGHQRNAQSMSALPITPVRRRAALLPSATVVPQTDPQRRFGEPTTPTPQKKGRRSRESTISMDGEDTEELARQALRSVQDAARRSLPTSSSQGNGYGGGGDDSDPYGSQASQAATEMLRRDAKRSFERRPVDEQERGPAAIGHNRQVSDLRNAADKRKFSGQHGTSEESPKKSRVGEESPVTRLGLGIQYSL